MKILDNPAKGADGEIQLTDAMRQLIGKQPFHDHTLDGRQLDCDGKAGWVTANLALTRDDIGPSVRAFTSETWATEDRTPVANTRPAPFGRALVTNI